MKKNNLYDFLIVLLLLIAASAFPFNYIIKDVLICDILKIVLLVAVYVFNIWFIKNKTNLEFNFGNLDKKYLILSIPAFLFCFTNFSFYFVDKSAFGSFSFENSFIVNVFSCIVVSLNEELIFRVVLLQNLNYKNKLVNVLVASGTFALCHIVTFIASRFNPQALVQVGYTFVFGLVLSSVYIFTNSYIYCVLMHFLFNLFNNEIFSKLISKTLWGEFSYYLCNAVTGLIVLGYIAALWIYFYKTKKDVSYEKN